MPRYNLAPIVRPADLRGRSIPSYVTEAVRTGRACLVGFESQGEAIRLLEAREATRTAYVPEARSEPARRWVSLADMPVRAVFADEVDAYPAPRGGRGGRGVGVTGPSRRGA